MKVSRRVFDQACGHVPVDVLLVSLGRLGDSARFRSEGEVKAKKKTLCFLIVDATRPLRFDGAWGPGNLEQRPGGSNIIGGANLHVRYGGIPRARSGTAWRTVLWVVLHVSSRLWVVSGRCKESTCGCYVLRGFISPGPALRTPW